MMQTNPAIPPTTCAARNARVCSKVPKSWALNQWTLVDCTVRDLSASGARIICKDQMAVQNEFRFLILADNTICNAKVVWRRGDELGIAFTSEKTRAPARKI